MVSQRISKAKVACSEHHSLFFNANILARNVKRNVEDHTVYFVNGVYVRESRRWCINLRRDVLFSLYTVAVLRKSPVLKGINRTQLNNEINDNEVCTVPYYISQRPETMSHMSNAFRPRFRKNPYMRKHWSILFNFVSFLGCFPLPRLFLKSCPSPLEVPLQSIINPTHPPLPFISLTPHLPPLPHFLNSSTLHSSTFQPSHLF